MPHDRSRWPPVPPTRYGAPGTLPSAQAKTAGASVPVPPTRYGMPRGAASVQAKASGQVVQPVVKIAGSPVSKQQFINATNGFKGSEKKKIRTEIENSDKEFEKYDEFLSWVQKHRGFLRRSRSVERGRRRRDGDGYTVELGHVLKKKHYYVNLGVEKSKKIKRLFDKRKKIKKKVFRVEKIDAEMIDGMFGKVKLYDHGNFDSTPFATSSLSLFNHNKKKDKRAKNPPKTQKSSDSYVQLIHDIKNSGVPEKDMAKAMLAFLNDQAWTIDKSLTSYVKKAVSIFLVATHASEEGRNDGAAKFARTLLKAIADGKGTFATYFSGNTAVFTPARPGGGSGLFAQEMKGNHDNPTGDEMALTYQSDSSDEEIDPEDYDPDDDNFWK